MNAKLNAWVGLLVEILVIQNIIYLIIQHAYFDVQFSFTLLCMYEWALKIVSVQTGIATKHLHWLQ